jgi:hypothetical protein
MRKEDRLSRLGPLSGLLFVILELGGVVIGAAGGRSMTTIADPTAKILKSFADPVGSVVWIGAYMEFASLVAFAVFAAWLFRDARGPLAIAGLLTVAAYIAVTIVGLVLGDVLEYRAGGGAGPQETMTLFDIQSGLFVSTWGLAAVFLLFAPATGWLRRSAVVIAVLQLVALAGPNTGPAQMTNLLFLLWCAGAGIALARRPQSATARVPAAARA